MSKKAISNTAAAVIIVVIVIVAAVGVYLATRPGAPPIPGEFEISALTVSPSSVTWGETVTISVDVQNTGETEVTENIPIVLNDVVNLTKTETLAANETKTVTFPVSNGTYTAPGTYTVTVPGTTLTDTFTVEARAHVGLVLATGGLGDKSFNDISYAGVKRAEVELGIDFDYVQPQAIAEYEGYQRDFAKTGHYAIIICVGFDQADALTIVAGEYPDQSFAIVDMVVDKSNVASLLFKANEGSFLVGVAAGMNTETDKVGFVGGMEIDLIKDFFMGYDAGAKWANPNVTVLPPVYVGGWADPAKGKELALGLVDLGADAIFVAAGKSGLGALEAVNETGVTGLGVDACQCYLYPEIVASMTKRVDVAVFEMIKAAVEGTFEGGVYSGGLEEEWVGCCRLPEEEEFWEQEFEFTHTPLEASVTDKIKDARDKIVAGEITVPSAF
jgi:basic membrane protein A